MATREELYDLVWSKPMLRVGDDFGVSSSYMARVCEGLNIPRPERGYWAKFAVGKAPKQEPLPNARPGDPQSWSRGAELPVISKGRFTATTRPGTGPQTVRVPKDAVHALVRGAKAHFEAGRPVEDDAYLKPYKKLLVDVLTSKAALDKSLLFTNALFNALERAGHHVVIAAPNERSRRAAIDERENPDKRSEHSSYGIWSPYRPTLVYIGNVPIGLTVVEMSEQVVMRYVGSGKYVREADYLPPKNRPYQTDHTWTTAKAIPSGRLKLVAYSPSHAVTWSREWKQVKAPLDRDIPSIVTEIAASAVELVAKLDEAARQAEIARKKWEAERELQRRHEDARKVEQSVKESREELAQTIRQWSHAVSIEQFFLGIQKRANDLDPDQRVAALDRLILARSFLGNLDPLEFFMAWKTPLERYRPMYVKNDEHIADQH